MSHKWYGKLGKGVLIVLVLATFSFTACEQKFPGEPQKVLEQYIAAVQKQDFKTMYNSHTQTARQQKFLSKTIIGNVKIVLKKNYDDNQAAFKSSTPSLSPGVLWTEKLYFPASAIVEIGEPYSPKPAGEDPVNADYESANNVYLPVSVTYTTVKDSLEFQGGKIKSAKFECVLGKIREGKNVRIYSHDDKWFFSGCVMDTSSASNF